MNLGQIGVFLDTNIYINECFNFSERSNFCYLKKLVDYKTIVLISNEIVKKEVIKHLTQEIGSSINIIKKTLDEKITESNRTVKQALTIFRTMSEYESFFNSFRPDKQKMITQAIEKFNKFLEDTNTTVFSNEDVDVEEILHDYFSSNLPFEEKKSKKSEFPDAIMIKKLRDIAVDFSEIIVVSKDKGFLKAVQELKIDNVKCYTDLKSVLENFIGENFLDQRIAVKECFNDISIRQNIEYQIKNDLLSDDIVHVDGLDYEGNGVISGFDYDEIQIESADGLMFGPLSIKAIDQMTADIEFDCIAEINIIGTCLDEDNSIWDSEDKEYAYLSYIEVEEYHRVCFECTALLDISDIDEIIVKTVEFENVSLDEETRVSRIISSDELCHYCHNKPGVFSDAKGNWVCEDCIADNSNGIVCTNCGRLVSNNNFDGEMCYECRDKED